MSSFEFAFTLYGLVLGLSVTEVVSGFARVLRARKAIRLGWLTPAIGVLLLVDLVTFWSNAWDVRAAIPATFGTLLFGTAVASVYFLSASLVFPTELGEWTDLDDYFMRHKGQVIAGVIVANLMVHLAELWRFGGGGWMDLAVATSFTAPGLLLIFARSKWLCGAVLVLLLSLYAVFRLI
jgi:hypothetical protein